MEDRINKVIDSLVQGTENKKLNWQGTARETEFIINLKQGSITVDSWANYDPENDVNYEMADISFLNTNGERVETVSFSRHEENEEYRKIYNLHNIARRNSLRIDETIDSMLEEISNKINK